MRCHLPLNFDHADGLRSALPLRGPRHPRAPGLPIGGMASYGSLFQKNTSERGLLGDGRLAVTLEDVKSGSVYQSLVPLEGETLEQIFEHYLAQSEQLEAFLRLYADGGAICGALLVKLPGAAGRAFGGLD